MRAVSSIDENPIHKFVELYDSYSMPSFLTDGTMDPKLLKIYVLVHDLQDGPVDGYVSLMCFSSCPYEYWTRTLLHIVILLVAIIFIRKY